MAPPKAKRRGSSQPIMGVLDVLGRRWALRVLWELRSGPATFRVLRAACGDVSPSVLNQRLHELRELGVVDRDEDGYELTAQGQSLGEILLELDRWARRG